jgi:hypothetical protein
MDALVFRCTNHLSPDGCVFRFSVIPVREIGRPFNHLPITIS